MTKYVHVITKDETHISINKQNVSMIRSFYKDGFPTVIVYFCGDECLTLSKNPDLDNYVSAVELDELLTQITDDSGRY